MNRYRAQAAGHYPIEIPLPDISPWARGGADIPYVHCFDSGAPGPHVMVNALTHGNEVCGAVVVKAMLDRGLRPRRGRLTLSFANVDAYQRFTAGNPDVSRFVDQDLNRVWTADVLDNAGLDSVELRRARQMRPVIDTVDLLLDIHSMHERSEPLLLCGPLDKGVDFARQLGIPGNIVVDKGHSEGCRLRDYAGFGDPASPKNALLVECGQHGEKSGISVAEQCTARFLLVAGVIDAGDLPASWIREPESKPKVMRVTHAITASTMDFRFAGQYTGLELLPDAGTVIGWNDGEPVVTPYDNCVLVMPSLRQLRPGVTVVRLAQLED